jgi:hypothetical protein
MAAYAHFFTIGSGLYLGLEGWSRSTCVTRPNRVHLRYGSRVRSAGLRRHRLLRAPPALLPAERAINRVSTLQDTRSARLALALQTHTDFFPLSTRLRIKLKDLAHALTEENSSIAAR